MADRQSILRQIEEKLTRLYGADRAPEILAAIERLVGASVSAGEKGLNLSEKNVILITYGDMIHKTGEYPLETLHNFLNDRVHPYIDTVHILPFYPYSSDDGFSVIDYYAVDPTLGNWQHIRALHQDFRLMFDAVFNHISAKSAWFQSYLRQEKPYDDYFITTDPSLDLSLVRRPRALPLLTAFPTSSGTKHVWTTFSEDQIDLNFANPAVLLEILRALLFYVEQGADLIRLDAIAYLWKIIGTSSIHLEETHLVVRLMRDVLDLVKPEVIIITETNVPHEENLSYFGDGTNEAQMVYQFSLPPLLLHTFRTGSAEVLTRWAGTLERVSDQTTFFNFTASHDGIGVTPARGLLADQEIDALVALAEEHGGYVSYKDNSDGTRSPYELNITYFDAITHPDITAQQPDAAVDRFICSQAIMLSLMGVPGIYFNSLFGSHNYRAGVEETGRFRTINRQKFDVHDLQAELADSKSIRHEVFRRYRQLLAIRTREKAFHPLGSQQVLSIHPTVFAVERIWEEAHVLAIHHVSGEAQEITIPASPSGHWEDLLTGEKCTTSSLLRLTLVPYQIVWLKAV